jgi:glutamine synthetase
LAAFPGTKKELLKIIYQQIKFQIMSKLRFRVVETAFKKKAVEVAVPAERPSEYFGKFVFNRTKMYKYLPDKVYQKLVDAIDNGTALDRTIADDVAAGMKKWAIEMGATHYTHWFHPLTEGTAEKHEAFVEHDGKGGMWKNSRANCWFNKN